jgi:hypothetical protein
MADGISLTGDDFTDDPISTTATNDSDEVGEQIVAAGFDDADGAYAEQFQLSVGRVVVEDKEDGEEIVQWKAKAHDGTEEVGHVSSSPTDCVMSVIEDVTGGII